MPETLCNLKNLSMFGESLPLEIDMAAQVFGLQ
jgi:hypothetical protein